MSQPFLGEIKIISWNFPPKGWAFCNGQFLPINQNSFRQRVGPSAMASSYPLIKTRRSFQYLAPPMAATDKQHLPCPISAAEFPSTRAINLQRARLADKRFTR